MASHENNNWAIHVEAAKPEDAEGIFEVQRLTWIATYPNLKAGITEEDVRTRIEGKHGELIPQKIERWRSGIETAGNKRAIFVVRENEKVVGFSAPTIMDGKRRIGALYILPEMQGKGMGRKLLERAIEWHGRDENIFVRVASYNQYAIIFYKRNGFEETNNEVKDEAAQLGKYKEIPEIEMVLPANSN